MNTLILDTAWTKAIISIYGDGVNDEVDLKHDEYSTDRNR